MSKVMPEGIVPLMLLLNMLIAMTDMLQASSEEIVPLICVLVKERV